jgi:excisionase family DNA binding protein
MSTSLTTKRTLLYLALMELRDKIAVSVREAAAMLSVSPRTIQNYIRAKVLPGRKIGRRTVIPVRALELFVRSDHSSPTRSVGGEAGAEQG